MKTSYYQYTDKHRWQIEDHDSLGIVICNLQENIKFLWLNKWIDIQSHEFYPEGDYMLTITNFLKSKSLFSRVVFTQTHVMPRYLNWSLDSIYQDYLAHKIAAKNRKSIIAKMMEDIKID